MKQFIILLAAVCMAAASPAQDRQDGKPPRKCNCKHPKQMKKHKHFPLPPCPPKNEKGTQGGEN